VIGKYHLLITRSPLRPQLKSSLRKGRPDGIR
jgi:hypothetical protein